MHLTLRIKKKWFNEIAHGRKLIEYREYKAYYHRLLAKGVPRSITLHYQTEHRIDARVSSLRVAQHKELGKCYALYLKDIRVYRKKLA